MLKIIVQSQKHNSLSKALYVFSFNCWCAAVSSPLGQGTGNMWQENQYAKTQKRTRKWLLFCFLRQSVWHNLIKYRTNITLAVTFRPLTCHRTVIRLFCLLFLAVHGWTLAVRLPKVALLLSSLSAWNLGRHSRINILLTSFEEHSLSQHTDKMQKVWKDA